MSFHRLALLLLLVGLFCLADSRPALAAKFVTARIHQDGVPVLEASGGIPDTATPAEAWRMLEQFTWKSVGAPQFERDPANPDGILLVGKLRLELTWTGKPMASATVDRLRLTPDSGESPWLRIPKEELKRTALAAGLEWQEPAPMPLGLLAGIAMVLIVGIGILIWKKRPAE